MFVEATRERAKLRMAIAGPAKSGKTYTSMSIMEALVPGEWCVIDTENGSASKYGGGCPFRFKVVELNDHHPNSYVKALGAAHAAGFKGVIIDSISHEWMGKNGCLQIVDELTDASSSKNSYTPWGKVTPLHQKVFETINRAPMHVIATMRVKTEYVLEPDSNGKLRPRKLGLAPVQRDGAEYEFDILMDMHMGFGYVEHTSRCAYLQNVAIQHPGAQVAQVIQAWLDGEPCPFNINMMPPAEEKITGVPTPDNKPKASEPRPNVPTKEVQKAPKLSPSAPPPVSDSNAQNATKPGTPGSSERDVSTASNEGTGEEKKPTVNSVDTPKTQTQDSAPNGASTTATQAITTIEPAQMEQLLQAARENEWTKGQVAKLLQTPYFGYTLANITQMSEKHWKEAVTIVTDSKNKKGVVTSMGGAEITPVQF